MDQGKFPYTKDYSTTIGPRVEEEHVAEISICGIMAILKLTKYSFDFLKNGKTLTVPANCSKEAKEEFPELSKNDKFENEEIVFKISEVKNNQIIKDDNENDGNIVPVFLNEKLNKNKLDVGQTNIIKYQIDVREAKPIE
ncbi:hypothetical protein Glove_301g35 [Diversispora epigaea]|uniref:Uncharacterized protein n=1 Tax=Diversispora epigaea TaxID=1348612 RepID=A0A397I1Y6_9GLOM|nr:hypothetical protein Glove_301g35 [Diversispora epigaea]